ncbi:hypothetical protein TNIN_345001 [Trichonephila inaurata madagascariensis]|uniref:Uncharacterized protein n=1 Tax=Trichonephila inaurata madagascariensis TaxID=2747483 RepID=A0A8X7CE25_9ARAC|nr:hypothetical protein TNIN_345001 [Trichonephila inaurata madagascariensis]
MWKNVTLCLPSLNRTPTVTKHFTVHSQQAFIYDEHITPTCPLIPDNSSHFHWQPCCLSDIGIRTQCDVIWCPAIQESPHTVSKEVFIRECGRTSHSVLLH